jgi:isovaleryl-CoA dehydrogenase
MIDWELDDEHTAIQDAAHKFAQSEIAPLARDVDLEARGFPEDLLIKMAAQGYFGMGIGGEQGGLGAGTLAMGLVTEEFCRASLAMGSIVQRNWLCGHILEQLRHCEPLLPGGGGRWRT